MEYNGQELSYGFATINDFVTLKSLLNKCKIHIEGVEDNLSNFIIVKDDEELIGSIGLEIYGAYGLLRSLAVEESYRNKGIAVELCTKLIAHAHLKGIRTIFLLTTTADTFFKKIGFDSIDKSNVPEQIRESLQFKVLCPDNAVCMVKKLHTDLVYFPKDILSLMPNMPGANMWKVALDNTMLTYFEIEPWSRFEKHNHESEQITLVLEGELFFEFDDKVICVKKDEVIAIPSFVYHTAYTNNLYVKAVDAWSPIRKFDNQKYDLYNE